MYQLKKSPVQSSNFWTGVVTIISAGLGYLAPDVTASISPNLPPLVVLVVNLANVLSHLIATRKKK